LCDATADSSTYSACASVVDCLQPTTPIGGSFSPARDGQGPIGNLWDGQVIYLTAYAGMGYGSKTTATSTTPALTMNLDAAYDDIAGKVAEISADQRHTTCNILAFVKMLDELILHPIHCGQRPSAAMCVLRRRHHESIKAGKGAACIVQLPKAPHSLATCFMLTFPAGRGRCRRVTVAVHKQRRLLGLLQRHHRLPAQQRQRHAHHWPCHVRILPLPLPGRGVVPPVPALHRHSLCERSGWYMVA
jgi:hypothetical protein